MSSNDDTAEALAVIEAYGRALQASDKDAILRLYADEAEIIPDPCRASPAAPTQSVRSMTRPSPPSGWRST
jgi:ketosteroid isomerase-like protein